MAADLLEIRPREIKLTFDLKKQSSCWIQLRNLSDQYVAFKVKSTSPKDYSVQPNMSVIEPNATCDLAVTMHRKKVHPPDSECKDKFLVQSTVVPFGAAEEDIASHMFSKDRSKYIKEKKLRVILVTPSHSPVLLANIGDSGKDLSCDTLIQRNRSLMGTRNEPHFHTADSRHPDDPITESELVHECEELKSKLHSIDSELCPAYETIMKLTDERSAVLREKEMLLRELESLRRKNRARRIQVGVPLLFVGLVGLISLIAQYRARS